MYSRRPAVIFIFLTLLLDVLGIGLIIPVAPRLVEQLQGQGEGAAGLIVGLLGGTYAAMQFIFSPVLGSLSDHVGRRPVLLVALLGSGLDYFAMALSPTLWVLFITRAINGISGATITVASAYVADVTPPERRAAGFGMIGAAFGLGFVLGPLLGGYLGDPKTVLPLVGHGDVHIPFFFAGGLSLLNWLYGCFVLPESLPAERRRAFDRRRANPVGVFEHLRRYPLVMGLGAAIFLMNIAMFMLHATWVLYTKHRYGWSPLAVGWSLAIVGIGAAIVQGGLARRLIPRLGEPRSLLLGVSIGTLAYVSYGLASEGWMIYVTIAVASLGGIAQPAAMAIISKAVRPDEQGEVQGALTALQSVASMIGFPLGGAVFGYFISDRAPMQLPGASYFVSAALCLLGVLVAARVLARHRAPEAATSAATG